VQNTGKTIEKMDSLAAGRAVPFISLKANAGGTDANAVLIFVIGMPGT
jgi:hypothetical protein